MGVKEELEALRNQGVTKKNAGKLKDASGLSTPEAEQEAIKAEQKRVSIGNYKKESVRNLQGYNEAKVAVQKGGDGSIPPSPSNAAPASTPAPAAAASTPAPVSAATPAAAAVSTPAAVDGGDDDDVPTLEDVPDLEEMPAMEEFPAMGDAGAGAAANTVAAPAPMNRAERKARKTVEKLGMKTVPGITHCVLKMRGRARGGVFTITKPDVYEKNGAYFIFGEARQGGGAGPGVSQAQQQAQAIQQLAALAGKSGEGGIEMPAGAAAAAAEASSSSPKIEEVVDNPAAVVDESGLEAKDIDLVVTQAGCSRAKAVKALRDNDGDLVNAIMSLTA